MKDEKSHIDTNVTKELALELYRLMFQNSENSEATSYDYSKINEKSFLNKISQNEELFSFKLKIKEAIVEGFTGAIDELKTHIIPNNTVYDDIIGLSARYNRIYGSFQRGIIDFKTADLELTKIENTLIYIVNNLNDSDLNHEGKTAANNG